METPYTILEKKDNIHIFLTLCSFVSICENRKINLANVFLLVLKESKYRDVFKKSLQLDNNYELIKIFLHHEPYLYKSKYITKFLKKNSIDL